MKLAVVTQLPASVECKTPLGLRLEMDMLCFRICASFEIMHLYILSISVQTLITLTI